MDVGVGVEKIAGGFELDKTPDLFTIDTNELDRPTLLMTWASYTGITKGKKAISQELGA